MLAQLRPSTPIQRSSTAPLSGGKRNVSIAGSGAREFHRGNQREAFAIEDAQQDFENVFTDRIFAGGGKQSGVETGATVPNPSIGASDAPSAAIERTAPL